MIKKFNNYLKVNEELEEEEVRGYYGNPNERKFDIKIDKLEFIMRNFGIEYTEEVDKKLDELLFLLDKQDNSRLKGE